MSTEMNVIKFHRAFGHPVRDRAQTISRDEAILVLKLIEEEFHELVDAMFPGASDFHKAGHTEDTSLVGEIEKYGNLYEYEPDLIEIADAIGDLDYVVNGAGVRHGIDMRILGDEVHRSNMSKLFDDGKPHYREDGKILKGPDFSKPDIKWVLNLAESV